MCSVVRPTRLATALATVALVALLVVHGARYGFLCDDAYITFRHARNLVEGHGLVFNPSERVEGTSGFLWALQLAGVWGLTGVDPETSSLALGWLSTLAAAALVVRLASTSPVGPGEGAVLVAMLLTATNHSIAVWCTGGLEARQVTALLLLSILLLHRARWRPLPLALAGAAFALVGLSRPEGLLFGACGGLWLCGEGRRTGRSAGSVARALGALALPQIAVAAAHLAFRLAYYGAPLPNTFYAKGETWPVAGLAYLTGAAVEHGLVVLVPLALLGARARLRAGDSLHVLSAVVVVPHLAVLVRVGGDHFEYRMLDAAFLLLFLAAADGVLALTTGLEGARRVAGGALVVAGVLPYALVVPWMEDVATAPLREGYRFGLHADLAEEDAGIAWHVPGVPVLAASYNAIRAWEHDRLVATRWAEHRAFARWRQERFGGYAGAELPAGLVMAEGSVGVLPYVLEDVEFVDVFGLVDPVIARLPVLPTPRGKVRRLAHPRKDWSRRAMQRGHSLSVRPHARTVGDALQKGRYALRLGPDSWMPFDADAVPAPLEGRRVVTRAPVEGVPLVHDGRTWEVERVLWSLGDLDGWTSTGTAFAEPARHARPTQTAVSGNVGPFLDSYTAADRDRATGTLRSPAFTAEAGQHLAFLVGGGAKPGVGVRVHGPDGPIATVRGATSEALRLVVLPLDGHAGEPLHIEVFDHATGPWGHVLADEMALVRETPRPAWAR
ncbi:MAG: hypothetical protein H6737_29685 [Alphaproteobacteria bacterium]|nr:hypothetical protein [Alphaproteobacteria bacterium]